MDGIRTAALGRFSGNDPLLSLDQFVKMSGEGNIVYFMNTNVSRLVDKSEISINQKIR